MKFYIKIVVLFFLLNSCSSTEDCVKSSGDATCKEVEVPFFDKIMVYNGITLNITQGEKTKVEIQTGSNLIDNIDVQVTNKMLVIKDNTSCNWVRKYGKTIVNVTVPDLTEIYSKTEKNINSMGVLNFSDLRLVSLDKQDGFEGTGTGDFKLKISCKNLFVETNNIAHFSLSGIVNTIFIGVYDGNGIVDTQNLTANEIQFYQRGTNSIYVNPKESIKGDIYSLGNVISVSKPPIVAVSEHYKGKMIFK